MEWPRLPQSSCKCPVQLLLCPPSHSQLCDLPLHLSPRPQPRRHAPDPNEPRSSVAETRELGCRSCPSPLFIVASKRDPPTSRARPPILFSSLDHPLSPHSSPLSHLLLPPLQPLSFARARVCLPPRTRNGFENYVRRGRHCGSAQAGRAEGFCPAPSGSRTSLSSHIDEVPPRRAEQQGTVLHHQVADHPLAPSST